MKVSDYIVTRLQQEGITNIFGYQGGNITHVIDSIGQCKNMEYIQTYNEQGAAFAANAYALVTENFGVAISSSGPGAINMINGIANAYYDSIPCLFITGDINTTTMRKTDLVRQNGFQEADIISMTKGITKMALTVHDSLDIPEILGTALKVMKTGRSGPVLLDIPHNIQREEIEVTEYLSHLTEVTTFNESCLKEVISDMDKAKRPVLLIGAGCRKKSERELLKKLLDKVDIPVVVSLCGKDAIDNMHSCYRGMIGSYGLSYSNKVLQEADLLLVLGSRMDERQRTGSIDTFASKAKIIHVDVDINELGHVKRDEIQINTSVAAFLYALTNEITLDKQHYGEWLRLTQMWMTEQLADNEYVFGKEIADRLRMVVGDKLDKCAICVDVGNHQMAAAQVISVGEESNYLNSAGLGSMGYALPAAIGAYYANKMKRVICITGDGGIMMNVQELQVFKREHIPLTLIVMNNKALGMIKSYQSLVFTERYYGSEWGYEAPDFCKLAEAFGFAYTRIGKEIDCSNIQSAQQQIIEIEV